MNSGNETLKMLIAEDEKHIRMMIKAVAVEIGAEVVAEAVNGREAVDLYRVAHPDITILDINMPILTGLEALEKINDCSPDACVIMLTSVADMDSVRKAVKYGAANYILKNTPVDEIQRLITETWEEHKAQKDI